MIAHNETSLEKPGMTDVNVEADLQVFLELCEFISTVIFDHLIRDSITPLALETTVDSACSLSHVSLLLSQE